MTVTMWGTSLENSAWQSQNSQTFAGLDWLSFCQCPSCSRSEGELCGSGDHCTCQRQHARKEDSIIQCQCWINCLKRKLTQSRVRSFHYSVVCTWSRAKSFHHSVLCSIRPNRYSSTQLTGQEEKQFSAPPLHCAGSMTRKFKEFIKGARTCKR